MNFCNFLILFYLILLFLSDYSGQSKVFKHSFGFFVNSDVLEFEFGFLRNVLHLSFSLFLLQFEGDTSDGAGLNSSHESGGVSGNLVSNSLGGDNSDIIKGSFVVMEVGGHSKKRISFYSNYIYFK